MYLFVYGTLRRGGTNHWRIATEAFVGRFRTTQKFYMITTQSRGVPYVSTKQMLPDTAPVEICGEIYDVSANVLESLDELEGVPHFYTRCLTTFCGESVITAYVYLIESLQILGEIRAASVGRFVPVTGGDFLEFIQKA